VTIRRWEPSESDVEQEVQHVAVLDHVFLAFGAHLAGILGALLALVGMKSSNAMVCARMKPRSKSPWITPAACGAVSPMWMVQARTSFTPAVK
jgi:hypothetical protein